MAHANVPTSARIRVRRGSGWMELALLAGLISGLSRIVGSPGTAAVGFPSQRGLGPPTRLALIDYDGHPFDFWHNPTAVKVAIFVRSDCPISNRLAPEIKRLVEKFRPRSVEFVTVYVDPQESLAEIRQHRRDFGYTCPGVQDARHTFVKLTGATVTPEAVVFNTQRRITYRGRINDLFVDFGKSRIEPTTNDLQDAIEATLRGQPVRQRMTKAVGCYIGDLE